MDVVIASVHRLFAEVVAEALRVSEPDVVVHVASNAQEVVELLEHVRPAALLVDEAVLLGLDDEPTGLDGVRLILMTGEVEAAAVAKARRLGFNAIVGRDVHLTEIRDVLHSADDDLVVIGLGAARPKRERTPGGAAHLTPRELEVLRMLTLGADNATIARGLQITPNTVRTHVQNVFGKLGVSSRLEAATMAIHTGIVPLQPNGAVDGSLLTQPRRG